MSYQSRAPRKKSDGSRGASKQKTGRLLSSESTCDILPARPSNSYRDFMKLREQSGPVPQDFLRDREQSEELRDPFEGWSE
jgi:hypothetical protein